MPKKETNPYSLMFGKEPSQMISRIVPSNEIYDDFLSETPSQQIYLITGVRGSGKTVLMSNISKKIEKEPDWIVVELNPADDLLHGLAAKLYNHMQLKDIFKKAKINLSFLGIGVEISGTDPITDLEVAITQMLENIKKHHKKVLITIDEATSTKEMRVFASAYQIFIRKDLPLFLMMTGLYENIDMIQNDKILTFLYRAPKINLKPLNLGSIARNYKDMFRLNDQDARIMAEYTKGYPFAFQVLGYYTYVNQGDYISSLNHYRLYLDEYVYQKIWSELSEKDKLILYNMAKIITENPEKKQPFCKISSLREKMQLKTNEFSPYRNRLIKKGIISGEERGILRFVLPLFEDFILDNYFE